MNFISRVVLILICGFSAATELNAQSKQTVRGTVVDVETQSPIPGVRIEVTSLSPAILGVTDERGLFRLANVPVGRHDLIFTAMGYEPAVFRNTDIQAAKELILNVQMREAVITGKEVEVRAKKDKGETNNDMATVSSRTFSIEESKRYAGSLNDVSRMAQNFAGVQGNNDSRNDIVIRGNSPIGVLYRLEGVDIPNPNHFAIAGTTGGPVSMLNNNVLANSDFMTGAFPAEYGNALSGVFDLKIRSGNNEKHEFLGQIGFNGAELMAEGPISRRHRSSYLVSYRYSTLELFELMGINLGTVALPRYQDLSFKLNFPNKKGAVHVFGVGGLSKVELLDSDADSTDLFAIQGTDTRFISNMGAIGAGQTFLLGEKSYLRWTLSMNVHQTIIKQDSITPVQNEEPVPYYRDNSLRGRQTLSMYVNHKFSTKHVLRAGAFINRMIFQLSDSIYRQPIDRFVVLSDFSGGVMLLQPYAQWQYRPTQRLTITSGLHYVYFQRSGSHNIEPRAGARYQIAPKHRISLGYGLHSQTAPLDVYFEYVESPGGVKVQPNRNLDLTKAHHMVLGYDFQINEHIRLKAETYYQHLYNVPVNGNSTSYSLLNQGADFGIFTPDTMMNNGTGRNMGVELTFEHFMKKGFYFLVTTSVYDSKYKGSDGVERNTAFNGRFAANGLVGKEFEMNKNKDNRKSRMYLTLDSRTTINGGRRYSPILIAESMMAGFTVRDHANAFTGKYPNYFRSDIKLGFKVYGKKVTQEWAVDLQNITNRKNLFTEDFSPVTGTLYPTYQIGFLPIMLYRIVF